MCIKIKEPIFHNRSIGVAKDLLHEGLNEVEILYESKKSGQRTYPHTYGFIGRNARKYPTQKIKGREIVIIPIDCLLRRR